MVAATGRKNEFLYRPQVTSYDFGGPLTEDGDPSKLFTAVRRVISELFPNISLPKMPKRKRKMKLGPISTTNMFGIAGLQHIARGRSVSSQHPLSFEEVGHAHGLMLYDATVTYQPHEPAVLRVEGIRDSGYVYVDGVFVDSLSRAEKNTAVMIKAKLHQVLTILVHNEGRMSSGKALGERKGIVYNVTLDKLLLTNWTMRPIPLINASWLTDYDQMRSIRKKIPLKTVSSSFEVCVFAAEFEVPHAEPYDTFLRPDQKTKGIAFLNGFNLGRYWPARGPQKTLYVPRTLFRKKNVLVLIELEGGFHRGGRAPVVHFEDEPELLGTVHKIDE
ncbi:beta-galactosidase-1-like protein isoform X2 [Rhipicephalus microplus]